MFIVVVVIVVRYMPFNIHFGGGQGWFESPDSGKVCGEIQSGDVSQACSGWRSRVR